MKKMAKILAMLLALVMILSLVACGPADDGKETTAGKPGDTDTTTAPQGGADETTAAPVAGGPVKGGVFKYYNSDLAPTFDPAGNGSWTTFIWSQNIWEGPLTLGDDGKAYPLVCEFEEAEDGSWIKLWVREGVKFSDGTDVEIEDVWATLQRCASLIGVVKTDFLDYISSTTIEDGVLTMNFSSYSTQIMWTLTNFRSCCNGVMPKEICEKYGTNLITDPADVIGTGPYKLDGANSVMAEKIVMTRNEHYLPCEASPDGNGYGSAKRQYLDGIEVQKLNDANAQLMALQSGDLTVIADNAEAWEALLKDQGYNRVMYPSNTAYFMFFNCAANRLTSDVNLRKAIAAAMDYDELLYAYRGEGRYTNIASPFQCGAEYDTEELFTSKDYFGRAANVELAKKYLAESNYKGETLKLVSNGEEGLAVIIDALGKAGINVTSTVVDNATAIAYAGDETQDWDFIFRGNPISAQFPAEMDMTFYRNWFKEGTDAWITTMRGNPLNSQVSIDACWEMATAMAEEVPFVLFGRGNEAYISAPNFQINREGAIRYFFNGYFTEE